jgi:hypothetical protein
MTNRIASLVLACIGVAALTCVLVPDTGHAQAPAAKTNAKVADVLRFSESFDGTANEQFPATTLKKGRVILTDVVVSTPNDAPTDFILRIGQGENVAFSVTMPPQTILSHSFGTGIEAQAGEVITIEVFEDFVGANENEVSVNLTGYTSKK